MKEIDWINEFVAKLFVNGAGEKAERLMLWRDSDLKNLGGWSEAAIRHLLTEAFLARTTPKVNP